MRNYNTHPGQAHLPVCLLDFFFRCSNRNLQNTVVRLGIQLLRTCQILGGLGVSGGNSKGALETASCVGVVAKMPTQSKAIRAARKPQQLSALRLVRCAQSYKSSMNVTFGSSRNVHEAFSPQLPGLNKVCKESCALFAVLNSIQVCFPSTTIAKKSPAHAPAKRLKVAHENTKSAMCDSGYAGHHNHAHVKGGPGAIVADSCSVFWTNLNLRPVCLTELDCTSEHLYAHHIKSVFSNTNTTVTGCMKHQAFISHALQRRA